MDASQESKEAFEHDTRASPYDFVGSRFNVMKFQFLGNEAFVDRIIGNNECGAV